MLASNHELRVEDEVETEYQRPDRGVHQVEDPILNNGCQEAKNEENQESDEEAPTTHGEVNLGLESKEGEAETEGCRDAHRYQHSIRIIGAGRDAEQERLTHRKYSQEDEIEGRFPANIWAAS